MPWEKDGIEFVNPLYWQRKITYNPTPEMLIEAGYKWEAPPSPPPIDTTAFDNACGQFREVCAAIGQTIGKPDFKGGFDEYGDFLNSQFAQENPAQTALFASMWSGANEYCKYEGAKLGYGQPEWWRKCWGIADER